MVQRSVDVPRNKSSPYINASSQGSLHSHDTGGSNELTQIHAEAYNESSSTLLDEVSESHSDASHVPDESSRHSLPSLNTTLVKVHAAIDLEFHQGTDGRYYMLDFSRSFPPQDAHIQSQ